MNQPQPLREVVDLTKPACNVIFNMALDEARERVASGDPKRVREIEFIDAIPKNASGKLLRRVLVEQERAKNA